MKTITDFVDHLSKWITTGSVTPLEKFTERASLLISHSMSTIIDKKEAVRVTSETESPCLNRKNTKIASSHSGAIQVYQTSGNRFPYYDSGRCFESDYLNEIPTTKKTEDHNPIQTQIFKEVQEVEKRIN